jgi:hypothetical protein
VFLALTGHGADDQTSGERSLQEVSA